MLLKVKKIVLFSFLIYVIPLYGEDNSRFSLGFSLFGGLSFAENSLSKDFFVKYGFDDPILNTGYNLGLSILGNWHVAKSFGLGLGIDIKREENFFLLKGEDINSNQEIDLDGRYSNLVFHNLLFVRLGNIGKNVGIVSYLGGGLSLNIFTANSMSETYVLKASSIGFVGKIGADLYLNRNLTIGLSFYSDFSPLIIDKWQGFLAKDSLEDKKISTLRFGFNVSVGFYIYTTKKYHKIEKPDKIPITKVEKKPDNVISLIKIKENKNYEDWLYRKLTSGNQGYSEGKTTEKKFI